METEGKIAFGRVANQSIVRQDVAVNLKVVFAVIKGEGACFLVNSIDCVATNALIIRNGVIGINPIGRIDGNAILSQIEECIEFPGFAIYDRLHDCHPLARERFCHIRFRAIHAVHAESGGISRAVSFLTKSRPLHDAVLDRLDFPAFALIRVVAYIFPTRAEQDAVNVIFGHGVFAGHPSVVFIQTVIDEGAVGLEFPTVQLTIGIGILVAGVTSFPSANNVGRIVMSHTHFMLLQPARDSV